MYIDAGEIVRVRVESDEFYDHEPGPPPKALEGVRVAREQKKAPYTIIVSQTTFSFANWFDGFSRVVFDCGARTWTCVVVEECGNRDDGPRLNVVHIFRSYYSHPLVVGSGGMEKKVQ
jgi:hypothetical protein